MELIIAAAAALGRRKNTSFQSEKGGNADGGQQKPRYLKVTRLRSEVSVAKPDETRARLITVIIGWLLSAVVHYQC